MISKTYGTMYYVDSMKDSVNYYKKTLGAKAVYESDYWTEFDFAGHKLCLHAKNPGEPYDANGLLILSHDGIKALFESMKADGVNVFGLHEVHPAAWTFHIKDNANNELSVYGAP